MKSPQPEGDLQDHTSLHSSHLKRTHSSHLTFSPRWRPVPVQRHLPTNPVPPSCHLRAFPFRHSPTSFSSIPLFSHPKKEPPTPALSDPPSPSFSLLIWAGIEPHPDPIQDPCSVCSGRVHTCWMAFLCMV